MYVKINKWYLQGLWSAAMVLAAAQKGILTDEQVQAIMEDAV